VIKHTHSQTVQVCWNGTPFEFTLAYKENVNLGSTTIRQIWMPLDTLYGNRKRGVLTGNARKIADLYRVSILDDPPNYYMVIFKLLFYLELVPRARREGSRHYLQDARIKPAILTQTVKEFDENMSSPVSSTYLSTFSDKARELLCPISMNDELRAEVEKLEERVFGEAVTLVGKRPWEELVEMVRKEWDQLCGTVGKRSRARVGVAKDAIDMMSWRMREAVHYAYTFVWRFFLWRNTMSIRQTDESYLFHAFWHCLPPEQDREKAIKRPTYFEGHILGLHPAGSILMRSPRGRKVVGQAIVNPEEYFGHLYSAYELALFCYQNALNYQKEARSKKSSSYTPELHDIDSDFIDDETRRQMKAMKRRK
jgi:hypothetical protein